MGAPKIRVSLSEARRMRRKAHDRLRAGTEPHVTVVQDEQTKAVLGVLIDRNAFQKFYDKCAADGVDLSHAELIDFQLTV